MPRPLRITFGLLLFVGIWMMSRTTLCGQWHIPIIGGPLPNSTTSLGEDCFQINSGANTRGAVWDSTQMDLSQPFDITLSINMQPWGADGMALVMQNDGLNAWGAGGNALGFGNSHPASGYPPIVNSIAFEVDVWDNSAAGVDDIPQDHVAIHTNGNLALARGNPAPALASGNDITDGLCHQLRVTWNPTINLINVYFDADPLPRISLTYNIIGNVFGGNPMVWWGITGSSGGSGMTQTVCVGRNFTQAGADRHACAGDTVHLQAQGGTNYTWTPGAPLLSNGNIPNPIFGPAAVGNYPYQVSVTNSALCTDIDSVIVIVETVPIANPGPAAAICLGDSLLLGTFGNPLYSYVWQPVTYLSNANSAQPWLNPTAAGLFNYNLIVTNITGMASCADTALIVVTARDTPTVNIVAVNDTICQGESSTLTAQVTGGNGPFGYTWLNGPLTPSQVVIPSVSSPYTVRIIDAYNCTTEGHFVLIVNDTPSVSIVATPDSICAGQSSTLVGSASSGTPSYSYLWSNSTLGPSTTLSPLTTTTVMLTVTDAAGCTNTSAAVVTVHVADSIALLSNDTFLCLGGALQVAQTFSTPGINSWQWTPAAGVSNPSIPNPVLAPTVGTTYYVQGLNTLTGCGYRDSLVIGYAALGPPNLNLGSDTAFCAGQVLSLNVGNTGFSYLWSDGSMGPTYIAHTNGWIWVNLFDTLGCGYLAEDSLLLTLHPLPQPILPADTTICPSDSLNLQAGVAPALYLWNTGATGAAIWTQGAGTYWVRVTDAHTCVGTDTFQLAFANNLVVTLTGLAPSYCISDNAVQLVYSPPNGVFTGPISGTGVFSPGNAGAGSHVLSYGVTDGTGCTYTSMAQTMVQAAPTAAQAGPDQMVSESAQLAGNAPLIGTGTWTLLNGTGQFSAVHDPLATLSGLAPGVYTLVWTIAEAPCPEGRDSMRITVEGISIPTGFSPNGDGVNDYFVIQGITSIVDAQLSIFNRWGNLVWQNMAYANQWDGRNLHGQALVEDTYYAVLSYGDKSYNTYVVLKRD